MPRPSKLVAFAFFALAPGCGPKDQHVEAPVEKLTAEQEILKVGTGWQALEQEHGTRGAPSKIAIFDIKRRSTLTLVKGSAEGEEKIELKERFEMRSGETFECRAEKTTRVRVRYGRRHGVPAVEVLRPSMILSRHCQPGGFPEPEIQLVGGSSRFVLQDEQLVGFHPPSERRVYLPHD
jgi:hypothetical protein